MARRNTWLPEEVTDGTRYVLEAYGQDKSGAVSFSGTSSFRMEM
jgi:hypothetical protein